MPSTYYACHPGGGGTTATSLDALRHDMEEPRWPPGSHEIFESTWPPTADAENRRWGRAIKHPDGTVQLIRDPPP